MHPHNHPIQILNFASRSGQGGEVFPTDVNAQGLMTTNNICATRTTTEPPESFLVNGLGLDPNLFEPPIHNLPPELLSYIFEFNDPSTVVPTPLTWSITRVCRRWREIAFSTPRLWSTIVLDASSTQAVNERFESLLEFLDTCLSLSKGLPLNFVVALRSLKPSVSDAIIDRLCAHAHRWQRAYFVLPSAAFLAPWKRHIQNNTPMLQSLGFGSVEGRSDSADLPDIFVNSRVGSLVLSSYQSHDVRVLSEPWPQIVSLRLISCAFQILPSILGHLPNLRELVFEGDLPHTALVYWGRPVELPNLLILRITGYLHHISKLLPVLYTPSLLHLSATLFKASFLSFGKHHADACIVQKFLSGLGTRVKEAQVVYVDRNDVNTTWDHIVRSVY